MEMRVSFSSHFSVLRINCLTSDGKGGDAGADAALFIAMSSSSTTGSILKGEDDIDDGVEVDAPLKITSRPSISLSTGRFQVIVPVIWLMK